METIFYVSRSGLPITAPGIRIANLSNLIDKNLYKIHYFCICEEKKEELELADKSYHDKYGNLTLIYQNNTYTYINLRNTVIENYVELFTSSRQFRELLKYIKEINPKIIILYNPTFSLENKLYRKAKQMDIRIFVDVTEWYEYRRNDTFNKRFIAKSVDKRIKKLDQDMDGIIAISQYLVDFYTKKKANVIYIPPIMLECPNVNVHINEIKECIYAGSPKQKDNIYNVISAVLKLNKNKINIKLKLIGITYEELMSYYRCEKEYLSTSGILCYGRLMHKDVIEILKNADFSFLFREPKRYAKAGFSTKLSECISLGIPILCNRVGGAECIIESYNCGWVIDNYEQTSIFNELTKIISYPSKKMEFYRKNCFIAYNNEIKGEQYRKRLNEFIRKGY